MSEIYEIERSDWLVTGPVFFSVRTAHPDLLILAHENKSKMLFPSIGRSVLITTLLDLENGPRPAYLVPVK
jgi:hypothetical protein